MLTAAEAPDPNRNHHPNQGPNLTDEDWRRWREIVGRNPSVHIGASVLSEAADVPDNRLELEETPIWERLIKEWYKGLDRRLPGTTKLDGVSVADYAISQISNGPDQSTTGVPPVDFDHIAEVMARNAGSRAQPRAVSQAPAGSGEALVDIDEGYRSNRGRTDGTRQRTGIGHWRPTRTGP